MEERPTLERSFLGVREAKADLANPSENFAIACDVIDVVHELSLPDDAERAPDIAVRSSRRGEPNGRIAGDSDRQAERA